ncbi:MAG TPA: cupin domain-containing protein, partial [Planctomycetota bacterium]|nr:cupin domain-containing protein [Planctomycetota bacterium]
MIRRLLALALVLVLALAALPRPALAQTGAIHDMEKLIAEHPLGDAPSRTDEIARTDSVSVHLIQTRTEVPLNFHEAHDELVFLWSGAGMLEVAGVAREMKRGEWVLIPRHAPHAFRAEGGKPAAALSIFTPAFDGKDRILAPHDVESERKPHLNDTVERFVDAYRKGDVEMVAALERVSVTRTARGPEFDPAACARIRREIDATRRDPCARWALDAIASFPHLDDVTATAAAAVTLTVDAATGPYAFAVTLDVRERAGDWVVAGFGLAPRNGEARALCEAAASSPTGTAELEANMFPRGTFGRVDPVDLRDIVRANRAIERRAHQMPSIRGLWR